MDGNLWEIIVTCGFIFILLLLAAFFSAGETAMTGASKARLHALTKDGDKRAALVNKIRARKDRMIGAMLLGNNLVNILSSALATGVMIYLFGREGVFYATAIMTVLILVFAEVLPKTYALYDADRLAMRLAPAVNFCIWIFTPFTAAVAMAVRGILRLCGQGIRAEGQDDNADILRGAIDLHDMADEESHERRAMLRSVLDLADVTVEEVMTYRNNVQMLDATQPVEDIIAAMLQSPYTRIPLWRDNSDNIVGIINTKSLLREIRARGGDSDNLDITMIANDPWFIPNSTTLFDQLQAFRQRREHFAIVVDEYGTLMGVVTLEDIIEEIVGDIADEMDKAVAGVRRQGNGSFLIDGNVTIRDLNREFDWDLPVDSDYSTLAGLILYEAHKLPSAGQSFNFYGFRFDIVRRDRHQLSLIRVMPPRR